MQTIYSTDRVDYNDPDILDIVERFLFSTLRHVSLVPLVNVACGLDFDVDMRYRQQNNMCQMIWSLDPRLSEDLH